MLWSLQWGCQRTFIPNEKCLDYVVKEKIVTTKAQSVIPILQKNMHVCAWTVKKSLGR